MNIFIIFIFFNILPIFLTWDLSSIVVNNNFTLTHVSLYYIRAFLCIKTLSIHNRTVSSFVEATWPENFLIIKPKVFPNNSAHAINKNDCNKIIQAESTDIDNTGRLWLLDSGNKNCYPKLIIYDLIRKNTEVLRVEFENINNNKLISIKIDPESSNTGNYKSYISFEHGNFLIIFSLLTQKWRLTEVLIRNNWINKPIKSIEIAFTLNSRFYITDNNGNLYISNTSNIKSNQIFAKYLGRLLGKPKGIITDAKGSLYYIITKFGAVVRWIPTNTLNAEGHDLIAFHSLSITQMIFGVKGSVWLVLEKMQPTRDHCVKVISFRGIN